MSTEVFDAIDAPEASNADSGTAAASADQVTQRAAASDLPAGGGTSDAGNPAANGSAGTAQPAAAAQQTIPLAAHLEERRKLQSRIAELEQQPKLSKEDLEALKDLREQRAQQNQPKDPDFLQDPKGYVDAKTASALKALDEVKKANEDLTKARTQEQEHHTLMQAATVSEQTFVQAQPDYYQALEHIRGVRKSQLSILYPEATPEQLAQAVASEELQAVRHALTTNRSPAEFAYSYAKTMGYAPQAVQQNGAAPAKPADKSAARSMGSGGSDSQPDAGDDDDPNAEFNSAMKELKAQFKRR